MRKAELLTNKPDQIIKNMLPPPFREIAYKKDGKILGGIIHMGNKPFLAINDRLQKAKATCGMLRKNLFLNEGLKQRIRIQPWNALVRSTMTYALHTRTHEHIIQLQKMESFAYKCIRQIHDPTWYQTPQNKN